MYDGTGFIEYGADKVETDRLHGSGCVYSSAITARLAIGQPLPEAVGFARDFITRAIQSAPPLGDGIAPVNPLFSFWNTPANSE
jgi:hydroxymethylpyrimidine/phosphomethylpyrimidine kinase